MQDRIFWVILSKSWREWPNLLIVVKPDTVVRWHKKGFKPFWRLKSRESGPVGGTPFEFRKETAAYNAVLGTKKLQYSPQIERIKHGLEYNTGC